MKLALSSPFTPRRAHRVLLLVQQDTAIHAFSAQGNVLTPLPPLSATTLSADEHAGETYSAIRLCLAASSVFFRVWTFPFRSRAAIRQALQLLMRSELPFEPDTLEHALLFQPCANKATLVLSASVHKARLDALLDTLRSYHIEPDSITVDPFPFIACLVDGRPTGRQVHCLLREDHTLLVYMNAGTAQAVQMLQTGWTALCPVPQNAGAQNALPQDTTATETFAATVRTNGFCAALEREGQAFDAVQAQRVFTGLHAEAVQLFRQYAEEDAPDIQLHCALFAEARTASLFAKTRCADAFGDLHLALPFAEPEAALLSVRTTPAEFPTPKKRSSAFLPGRAGIGKLGLAGALVLICALLALVAEGTFLSRRTARLEAETVSLFQRTLPELGGRTFGMVQRESILRQRVLALTSPQTESTSVSVVRLLTAVHQALDTSFSVRFTGFRLARNVASLTGVTDGYETVNRIRDTLAGLPEVESVRLLTAGAETQGTRAKAKSNQPEARSVVFEFEIVAK